MFIRLLITDIKRIFTYIPSILISIVIIGGVLFAAAFCSDRLFYDEQEAQPINVGIVMYISSDYGAAAYNMVAGMDSYSSYCSIIEIPDEETGLSMIADGELTAMIVVPDNIISDINNGTNTPIKVVYEPDGTFESYILNEIFVSTSSMLAVSEAAIYTGTKLARNMELSEETVKSINHDLNMLMTEYVLARTDIFETEQIYVTGTYSVTEHYMVTAVILITLLSGVAFMGFMKGNNTALRNKLHIYGINDFLIFLSRLISVFIYLCGITIAGCIAVCIITYASGLNQPVFSLKLVLGLFLTSFCAAILITFIGSISGSHYTACMLLVSAVLIFAYVGGLLVPQNLLPEVIRHIAPYTPLYRLNDLLCGLMFAG